MFREGCISVYKCAYLSSHGVFLLAHIQSYTCTEVLANKIKIAHFTPDAGLCIVLV